jgi:DNA topoisomerase-1
VRRSRHGSFFVGCDGYPDCEYTLPLPSTGEPTTLDESCEEHGLARVKMLAGRDTFVHGCPRCRQEEADDSEDEVIGACPECGEGAASATPRGEGGKAAEAGGELAIKHLRSGSRLVGCTRYPDCDYSLPLPRRGDIVITEARCEEHDLPELEVREEGDDEDDDPWELGCPICNYDEYRERQRTTEIDDLDGVGEKTAAKLEEAGVEDLEDLLDIDPDDLADRVQGVSADRVREWQTQVGAG